MPLIVGGRPADERITAPEYWAERDGALAEPVAVSGDAGVLLELGPCPVLPAGPRPPVVLPVLDGEQPEVRALFTALAVLHGQGAPVRWAGLLDQEPSPRTVPLPTYAFQRERYWPYGTGPAAPEAERREADAGRTGDI